jgi:hypothetical protein
MGDQRLHKTPRDRVSGRPFFLLWIVAGGDSITASRHDNLVDSAPKS